MKKSKIESVIGIAFLIVLSLFVKAHAVYAGPSSTSEAKDSGARCRC